MVRVAVAGIAGRMGGAIARALACNPKAEFVGGFEAPDNPAVGKTLAEVTGFAGASGTVSGKAAEVIKNARVLVDFTAPIASLENLEICAKLGKASVIGTTGFNPEHKKLLKRLSKKVPMVVAPNMSAGMNLMFKLAGIITQVLGPDYALELVEAHHDQKKDAPSGSAVRLLEEMAHVRGLDLDAALRHGRQGMVGARTKDEIGVSVIRGGDIVGEHTVYFIGQGERIELTHRAHSRDTFAQGAVRAALWVEHQEPGLYDMQDVLGLGG